MTRKTHLTVGIATTLPLLSICPVYAIVGIIGATLADWDIKLGIKHRTITHSLIALLITTAPVMLFNFDIGIIFGFNFLMHLILDSFTKMGVPFLYPFNKRYYGMRIVKTGGITDYSITLMSIYYIFLGWKP